MKSIRITHKYSDEVIAEGPLGKGGIKSFEGNYYIPKQYIISRGFKNTFFPGLCIYKFFYTWFDLQLASGQKVKFIGWKYFLPNPMFWFVFMKLGIPNNHTELTYEIIN